MFVKRARPRPSLRARDSDIPDPASTSSPLAKSSITASDAQNSDESIEIDSNEGSGNILGRKKGLKKEKTKDRLSKKASTLSFGGAADEDEGVAFKPRKSLLSQQLKLPPTPSTSEAIGTPSATKNSGVYSREYLSELKAATPTRAPRGVTDTIEDDNDDVDSSGLSRLAREKYASSFAQDTTAGIPDATTIAAAKMKRQAGMGGNGAATASAESEEDYISLGSGGGKIAIYDAQQGPHPESRLMREEDEEGEGDEGKFALGFLTMARRTETLL